MTNKEDDRHLSYLIMAGTEGCKEKWNSVTVDSRTGLNQGAIGLYG